MNETNNTITSSDGRVRRTPEEIAERHAWMDRFLEESKRLDEIEPLPDNFEDICKGAWPPVYSKAHR
jgi:hypothetical protein